MSAPYGLQAMLKDGHKHLSGLDEAVMKNIEAASQLSKICRTSLGPNGMNKMVINHLNKLFVTNDSATIMSELEVQHPAAKLLVMAAKAQESEVGDGTNLVVTLAGEMLAQAESLLRDGLHTSEVIDGYTKAGEMALAALPELVVDGTDALDVRDAAAVASRIKSCIASKQYGYEGFLSELVARACIEVCPKNPHNFNVDNVRVAKVLGSSVRDSSVVSGVVVRRDTEGTVKHVKDAKVAVFAQGIEAAGTETKGTVLIDSAEQLENYAMGEEAKMEAYVKGIADAGAKIVVSGSSISELAMHFLERYGLMVLKIVSKFELRRLCRTCGATAVVKCVAPQPDELGYVGAADVVEIGGVPVTVFKQEVDGKTGVSTVLLRASTNNAMDDIERAVDDGVNAYKALCKDARMVPGAGATEMALAQRLSAAGRTEKGLGQYAIQKFSKALELVPRILAENAGINATELVSQLYAAHAAGTSGAGVDVEAGAVADLSAQVQDLFIAKHWAIKLAVDAAVTVLRVDQIIMAKQAGGPAAPQGGPGDDD